jgi:Holliday junction resolvase RusA-like endonuclease
MLGRPEKQYVVVELPMPISTNRLWVPIRRGSSVSVVKSKDYLAWISEAGYKLNSQRPGMVVGHFALHLWVGRNRLDLDNAVKAALDLLQSQGVIENDRLCVSLRVKREDSYGMRAMVVSTKER